MIIGLDYVILYVHNSFKSPVIRILALHVIARLENHAAHKTTHDVAGFREQKRCSVVGLTIREGEHGGGAVGKTIAVEAIRGGGGTIHAHLWIGAAGKAQVGHDLVPFVIDVGVYFVCEAEVVRIKRATGIMSGCAEP